LPDAEQRFIREVAAHTSVRYVRWRVLAIYAMLLLLLALSGGVGLGTLVWLITDETTTSS